MHDWWRLHRLLHLRWRRWWGNDDWNPFDRAAFLDRHLILANVTQHIEPIRRIRVNIRLITPRIKSRPINFRILAFANDLLLGLGVLLGLVAHLLPDGLLLLLYLLLLVLTLALALQEIYECLLFIFVHLLELFWANEQVWEWSELLLLLLFLNRLHRLNWLLLLRLLRHLLLLLRRLRWRCLELLLLLLFSDSRFGAELRHDLAIDGYLELTVRISWRLLDLLLRIVRSSALLPGSRLLLGLTLLLLAVLVHMDVDDVLLLDVAPNRYILLITFVWWGPLGSAAILL